MSAITTHILDTTTGKPGTGIAVALEHKTHTSGWQVIAQGVSDADGRINDLLSPKEPFAAGLYRLNFETGPYFLMQNVEYFFPQITINFVVRDPSEHYHVPLLLNSFSFTVYRGG